MAMLARAFAAEVPFAWITADEAYGQVTYLRLWLATKVNDTLVTTGGREARADELIAGLPARSWRRLSVGERSRTRSVSGPVLAGLVCPHHPVDARPRLVRRLSIPCRKEGTAAGEPGMIGFTLPEIRRLLTKLVLRLADAADHIWFWDRSEIPSFRPHAGPVDGYMAPVEQALAAEFVQEHVAQLAPPPDLGPLAETAVRGLERQPNDGGRSRQAHPLVRTYTIAVNTARAHIGAVPSPCGRGWNTGINRPLYAKCAGPATHQVRHRRVRTAPGLRFSAKVNRMPGDEADRVRDSTFLGWLAEASSERFDDDALEPVWGYAVEIGVNVGQQYDRLAHDIRVFRGLVRVHDIHGIGLLQALE